MTTRVTLPTSATPTGCSAQATRRRSAGSNRLAMDRMRLVASLGLAVGCTASESEVRPPADALLFPTAVAVSPDDSVAFVASGNSDLSFDSGTVQVVDLAVVEQVVAAWKAGRTAPPGCVPSIDHPETLACPEAEFLIGDAANPAGVRIGNFASAIGVQDLMDGGRLRLLVPVRGDPSLTWMEWDPAMRRLSCGTGAGFALCDDAHRLTRLRGDDDLPAIPDEPYGVYVDSTAEFAVVTHFVSGVMSLVDAPRAGVPELSDAVASGISSGLSGVAGRKPGADNLIYVQSRGSDRVFVMTVARQADQPARLVGDGFFIQDGVGGGSSVGGESDDSRGLAFGSGGDRAYLVNRKPPSVQVLDTSLGQDGVPHNRLIGSTDICRQASSLALADTGLGDRVYVTCYNSGELYVVDPRGGGAVEATPLVGRGPISSAVAPSRRLLLVANFLDDSLAVVDLDPNSRFALHVVLTLGGPS